MGEQYRSEQLLDRSEILRNLKETENILLETSKMTGNGEMLAAKIHHARKSLEAIETIDEVRRVLVDLANAEQTGYGDVAALICPYEDFDGVEVNGGMTQGDGENVVERIQDLVTDAEQTLAQYQPPHPSKIEPGMEVPTETGGTAYLYPDSTDLDEVVHFVGFWINPEVGDNRLRAGSWDPDGDGRGTGIPPIDWERYFEGT